VSQARAARRLAGRRDLARTAVPVVQVVPVGEETRHRPDMDCWCGPTVELWVITGSKERHLVHSSLADPCGAQDWARDDDGRLIVYGTCRKPAGHGTRWHQDREPATGRLLAEWSGPADARAPAGETPCP
jgi:hypothetical protein